MRFATVALLAVLLLAPIAFYSGGPGFAVAQEDEDIEGDEVAIDEEDSFQEEGSLYEEDEDLQDPESLIGASKDVATFVSFPDNADFSFPAGSIATAFVGIHNSASEPFIITGIDGAIRQPDDYQTSFQNFTLQPFDIRVEPNTEATFDYKFRPADRFEPRDFILTLNLHFESADGSVFENTVFNSTVALVDAESDFDFKQIFVYLALIAVAAYVYISRSPKGVSITGKKKSARVETGSSSKTSVEDSFIADHLKQTSSSSKNKKKSKK